MAQWRLLVISAWCVARDLHTIAPGPLEHMCWRQSAAQWGDCDKSRIASFNAVIIIIIITQRQKLQTTVLVAPSHSMLTPAQPVPALTLCLASGHEATSIPISMQQRPDQGPQGVAGRWGVVLEGGGGAGEVIPYLLLRWTPHKACQPAPCWSCWLLA